VLDTDKENNISSNLVPIISPSSYLMQQFNSSSLTQMKAGREQQENNTTSSNQTQRGEYLVDEYSLVSISTT
jgi:hypothetical protein